MSKIVTEGDVRLFVGLEGELTSAERARVGVAHTHAEGLVKQFLGYDPVQRRHVEFYPKHLHAGGMGIREDEPIGWEKSGNRAVPLNRGGQVSKTLQLRHIPVRQIKNLYYDPDANFGQAARTTFDGSFDTTFDDTDFAPDTVKTNGEDYFIDLDEESIGWAGLVYWGSGVWPIEPGSVAVDYISGFSEAELMGGADADAAQADLRRGQISVVGVDASPIRYAVLLTCAKMLHVQQSLKRSDAGRGFDGGNVYESERFQDYSYKRPSGQISSTVQLTGLVVGLPTEALEALEPFKTYGRLRT